jgi:hypothetical protein
VGVELARGQYRLYGKLDSLLKAQWDAFEAFLTRISENRFLYVMGYFDPKGNWPSDQSKSLIFTRDKTLFRRRPLPGWSGVYGPCGSQQDLHELLVANPNEYFYFLVTDDLLESGSALGLYKEVDREVWDTLYQKVCNSVPRPYCGIAEAIDLDCISLQCRCETLDHLLDILDRVLAEFGLKLTVDTKKPGKRRRTEY